jgi:ketosteroid isomerase-like protein
MMKKTVYAVIGLMMCSGGVFAAAKADVEADKAAVLALEAKWDAAAVKGDIAAFDALYADTFVFTNSQGKVQTKAEVLNELRSGDLKYQTSKGDQIKVFLYGDAAVVTGRWTGKWVLKGKTTDSVEHYTGMYVRQQNGPWRLVATQTATIK